MGTGVKRLLGEFLWLVTTVVATSLVVYLILSNAPGAESEMPSFSSWLGSAVQGDLGESSRYRVGESVAVLLLRASVESIFLVGWAVIFSLIGSVILTILWSGGSSRAVSASSRIVTYVLSSSPVFLLGYWTLVAIGLSTKAAVRHGLIDRLDWFFAWESFGAPKYWVAALVLAIGNGMLMEAARSLDAEVRRIRESDFIVFARARGRPLWRHVGVSLVAPVTSSIVNRLTAIFGGAIVVEYIFNIPGLGRLTWEAATARDSRVLLGAVSLWAFNYAICHLLSDIVAAGVDPRLRRSAEGAA